MPPRKASASSVKVFRRQFSREVGLHKEAVNMDSQPPVGGQLLAATPMLRVFDAGV